MKRVVCLNCIDGRVQLPAIQWIKDNSAADYVDMITEPGMDGFLADQNCSIEDICRKLKISIEKNNASMIIVVGHYDCKGNPVDESTHKEHILSSIERLKLEFTNMPMTGLWINDEWKCERL